MTHNPDTISSGLRSWEYFPELRKRPELNSIYEEEWASERFIPTEDDVDKMIREL